RKRSGWTTRRAPAQRRGGIVHRSSTFPRGAAEARPGSGDYTGRYRRDCKQGGHRAIGGRLGTCGGAPVDDTSGRRDTFALETQVYQAILEHRPAQMIPRMKEVLTNPDPALNFNI